MCPTPEVPHDTSGHWWGAATYNYYYYAAASWVGKQLWLWSSVYMVTILVWKHQLENYCEAWRIYRLWFLMRSPYFRMRLHGLSQLCTTRSIDNFSMLHVSSHTIFIFVRWHLSWWCDPKRWHLPWWCDRTIVFNMYVLEDSDLISFRSGEFLIWPGDTSVHWDYDELLFPLTWAMFIITYLHFEGWRGQSCTRQGGVPKS